MAGHLLTLREGLLAMRNQPILSGERILAGLNDTLLLLEKHWGPRAPDTLKELQKQCFSSAELPSGALYSELKKMRTQCKHLTAASQHEGALVVRWAEHLEHQLVELCQEWSHLLAWLPLHTKARHCQH